MQGTAGRPLPPDTGALHALHVPVTASAPRVGGDWAEAEGHTAAWIEPLAGNSSCCSVPCGALALPVEEPRPGVGLTFGGKI